MTDRLALIYYSSQPSPSMGCAYLLSYWKDAGIDVSFFDTTFIGTHPSEIADVVIDFPVVAMSVHTLASGLAESVAHLLKMGDPDKKIVWGGPDAMARPEQLLSSSDVDFICIGEGEHFVPELYENNFDPNTRGNYPHGLAKPVSCKGMLYPELEPWREWCKRNYTPVMLGRGCPFSCSECSNSYYKELFKENGYTFVRNRPMGEVFDEIEYRLKEWLPETKGINVFTETFGSQINKFVAEYKHRNCSFDYVASSRPDVLTEEKVKLLAETNCKYCGIGIESGNPKIRKKYLHRNMTNEQIINAFKWLREYGIDTHSFNMVGLPYESWDTIKQLVDLNKAAGVEKAQVTVLYPFPMTKMYDLYYKKGWLSRKLVVSNTEAIRHGLLNYYDICSIDIPNFTPSQLLNIARGLPRVIAGEIDWKDFKNTIQKLA